MSQFIILETPSVTLFSETTDEAQEELLSIVSLSDVSIVCSEYNMCGSISTVSYKTDIQAATLEIDGSSYFNGAIHCDGSLTVTGPVTIQGNMLDKHVGEMFITDGIFRRKGGYHNYPQQSHSYCISAADIVVDCINGYYGSTNMLDIVRSLFFDKQQTEGVVSQLQSTVSVLTTQIAELKQLLMAKGVI